MLTVLQDGGKLGGKQVHERWTDMGGSTEQVLTTHGEWAMWAELDLTDAMNLIINN